MHYARILLKTPKHVRGASCELCVCLVVHALLLRGPCRVVPRCVQSFRVECGCVVVRGRASCYRVRPRGAVHSRAGRGFFEIRVFEV